MGFWDVDVNDSLDSMFDMNRDGALDLGEQALKYKYLTEESEDQDSIDHEFDELDFDDLDFMDEDERREALEDAGYDPDDFDDDPW